MSARAPIVLLLAGALLAGGLAATSASAGRLDDAGRALRAPGIWVHRDVTWLVGAREARRLARRIQDTGAPVRIAVLPQVEADESRGDPRAIALGIIRRARGAGLYVLVDQDGRMALAGVKLARDIDEYRLESAGNGPEGGVAGRLGELVRVVDQAARAAPRDFEPAAEPKGVSPSTGGGGGDEPLAGVAFGSAIFGAMAGFALYCLLRAVVAVARILTGAAGA